MAKKGGFGGLGGLGGLGGGGLGGMMKQVQKLQEDQERVAQEIEDARMEASAGGGVVTVYVYGQGDVLSRKIDPDAVDPEGVEMLEDLGLAAMNEAQGKARTFREEKQNQLMAGMPKIPGLM